MVQVNVIRDLTIYDPVLDPVVEEMHRRKVIVIEDRPVGRPDMQYSLCIQKGEVVGTTTASGKILFINHGLSCIKEWGMPDEVNVFFAPTKYWADKVDRRTTESNRDCVTYITGWPKLDIYYKNMSYRNNFRNILFKRYTNGKELPIIALMPTYNNDLSHKDRDLRKFSIRASLTMLNSSGNDYLVLTSLHEMEEAELFSGQNEISFANANIDIIIAADVVVADRGSLVFECAALDKPIVMVDNPDIPSYLHLESQLGLPLVDAGPHVTEEDMLDTINHMLEEPGWYSDRRKYWAAFVSGPFDGQRAMCIVDCILDYNKTRESSSTI